MNKGIHLLILAMLLIFFPSCAKNIEVVFPSNAYEYGFFLRLVAWLYCSLLFNRDIFDMDVVVFATKNTGLSYGVG